VTPFVADVLIPVGKIVAVILYPMVMVVVMIWLERRVVALMQLRLGPNRVGWQGLLQPVADAVKLFFKEDIVPRQADRLLFAISPLLVMFSSLLAFAFMPLGAPVRIGTYTLTLWVAESPVGLLIVLGLSSISVFGVIFGGWASNSKYPLMGALRSVVQVLSYEIPLGLTGPPLRASGVRRDLRKDIPYSSYEEFDFDVPVGANGDVYDRYLVRLEEICQSIRIVGQALDGLPEGEFRAKTPRVLKIAPGEAYQAIEAPKGVLGFTVRSNGSDRPEALSSPCYARPPG
jgi:hypothetical protein